jgi:hypothetical protein
MGEQADEPEESFTAEYVICFHFVLPVFLMFTLGKGESTASFMPFFERFLGSRNVF